MDRASGILALNLQHVRRRFDRAADGFDDIDFVHATTRDGLFERLQPVTVEATTVLDLGAATGSATRRLARRFRGARIISVDLSHRMLEVARGKRRWFARQSLLQAQAAALPLADGSIDVVYSNMMLPWVDNPGTVFGEVARVLRPGGLFAFSTLGPDSLLVLRHAWQAADRGEHVFQFPDMHDVGDALVGASLADPVLDVDRLSVSYASPAAIFEELTAAGARNSLANRTRTMVGKQRFAHMTESLSARSRDGRITVELELVYGHCWGTGGRPRDGEFRVAAEGIPLRRRNDV